MSICEISARLDSKWVIFLLLNKRTNTYCDNPTILLFGYVIYLIVYGADWNTVKIYTLDLDDFLKMPADAVY